MAWAGFLITVTLAAVGASVSLALTGQHLIIAGIAACFCLTTGAASIFAMDATRPTGFCFPGNLPENWFDSKDQQYSLKQANFEQAVSLNSMIKKNIDWADVSGRRLSRSMDLLLWGSVFWGSLLIIAVLLSI